MKHSIRSLLFLAVIPLIFSGSVSQDVINDSIFLQNNRVNYDVIFYHLDLNVSDTSTYISGSVTINIKPVVVSSLEQAAFDMSRYLYTDSVLVNGTKADFTHESDEITVDFPNPVNQGEIVSIAIFYHGLGKGIDIEGIYNREVTNWNQRVTWTLSEPFAALNFFPCKQSLADKADSVYVFLSTDSDLKAGSNGILTAEIPLDGNRIRYEWKSRFPIAYYLISFSVSDYMDYSYYTRIPETNDSILVQNYIYNNPAYLDQNKANIDKTGDLLILYSGLFGPYPFKTEKYGHCLAPFSGGMEHQTMTTLVNFSFLLVAHELTHQWFGDYVTCSTWQDIWINEGFASYGEYLAHQYLTSQEAANNWIRSCNDFVKTQPGGSVFVPENSAQSEGRIFDSRLSYKKGASIIHMIRQEVGNDILFFDILKTFLEGYGQSNASGADFRDHVEEKTGKDFHQFFEQWYFGQGYPIHSIRWHQQNDTLYINSLQTSSSVTPFFNLLLEFRVTGENLDTTLVFRQDANLRHWQAYVPKDITVLIPDPNHWLLIDVSDISETEESDTDHLFTVLPNPADDLLMITTSVNRPVDKYSIFIVNSDGKIVFRRESSALSEEINIKAYPSGIYFVIIKNGRSAYQKKIIIN